MGREAEDREAAVANDSASLVPQPAEPARRSHAPEPAPQLRTIAVQGQQLHVTEKQHAHLASVGVMANLAMAQAQQQHSYAPPPPSQSQAPRANGSGLGREQ